MSFDLAHESSTMFDSILSTSASSLEWSFEPFRVYLHAIKRAVDWLREVLESFKFAEMNFAESAS